MYGIQHNKAHSHAKTLDESKEITGFRALLTLYYYPILDSLFPLYILHSVGTIKRYTTRKRFLFAIIRTPHEGAKWATDTRRTREEGKEAACPYIHMMHHCRGRENTPPRHLEVSSQGYL